MTEIHTDGPESIGDVQPLDFLVDAPHPEDADIARQRVSVMTPIGVALLGLSEGASFYWDTRDNQRRMLTVIKVEQPGASEGD